MEDDGKRLFRKLSLSKSLEIYANPAIQIMVEYLYMIVKLEV
jgi:hypothetical protein